MKFWATAAVVLGVDWSSKYAASHALVREVPRKVLGDVLRLTLSYDLRRTFWLGIPHTPFVRVPGGTAAYFGVKLLILAAIPWFATRTSSRWAGLFGALAGAGIANTLEQMRTGAVINFLDVGLGVHRWPDFNLADATLVSVCLVLAVLLQRDAVRERGWRGSFFQRGSPLPASVRRATGDAE